MKVDLKTLAVGAGATCVVLATARNLWKPPSQAQATTSLADRDIKPDSEQFESLTDLFLVLMMHRFALRP